MKTIILALAAALTVTSTAAAQHAGHADHSGQAAAPAAGTVEGVGVVKKIDAKTGSVTIAHDPIKALNWPAMVMPFKVADKALIGQMKVGAKIRFQLNGQVIVGVRPF
ncbi:MAG: copper-binding protein [Pseudomonadota bacterium]|uniref:copper-binding protein n=1 Tax=Phenylobacterium sp. TaxID=1871053 RepID=UPI0025CD5CDC|nr:copper-binding protein [Phenylobacterium sp.]MBT9473211.1 copper-binding protein [Phenylobacterium sp.]